MNTNDQNEELEEEELIESLNTIYQEVEGDKKRLDALYRKGSLSDATALAGEVVQTLYPNLKDSLDVMRKIIGNHSEGILGLEDMVYQQNTKAIQILLTALVASGGIEPQTEREVLELIGNDEASPESFLTTADSTLLLTQLEAFERVLKEQSNGEPSTALKNLHTAMARIQEITEGTEEAPTTAIEPVETEGTEAEA